MVIFYFFLCSAVCAIYRTKGAGLCWGEWGEVMGSCGKGGEGAGNVEDSVAGLAGEL
nr:hypothetical protein [Tanacetum cinerariifolium]